MSTDAENHKLSDLRVVDLRGELEKRGLDKSGNKQILLERLQKALKNEGKDPETYQFEFEKKTTKRLSTSSNQLEDSNVKDDDPEEEGSENVEGTNASEQEDNKGKKKSAGKEEQQKQDDKKKTTGPTKKGVANEDNSGTGESESLIQLTLEEEEESFQDEEIDNAADKTGTEGDKLEKEDMKNTSSKNEDAANENEGNSEKNQDKKQEGNTTASVAASNKSASKFKRGYSQNRNLWITNIAQTTRATELKQALSSYGKVIGAKVVINAKYPGACCYGYVTMDTIEDADNCIAKLNNTELNGHIIRIEKVRPDHMNSIKLNPKQGSKSEKDKSKPYSHKSNRSKSQDGGENKEASKDDGDKDKKEKEEKEDENSLNKDSKRKSRSLDRNREKSRRRSHSKSSRTRLERDILTFDKIKEERERQRLRERERVLREQSRRSREESLRQSQVNRMQRTEAARLDREREKLRMEREKLEREKAEIIRLERERQKIEREKLELEKMELQRVKMRLQEEDRRPIKRPAPYRREGSYEERKRMAGDRRYDEPTPMRFEPPSVKAPTPPSKKFGASAKSRLGFDKREAYPKRDRDYEAERPHPQSSLPRGPPPTTITKYEGSSVFNISRERDVRDGRPREGAAPIANPRITKDSRYAERDRSPHYRSMRDERDRRPISDHKAEVRPQRDHRYPEPSKEPQRFDRNTGGNGWGHPNASANKMFNANPGSGMTMKPWGKDSWRPADASGNADRWNTGGMSRGAPPLSTGNFQGNSNMGMGPSCPPPPAINNYAAERFDYKSMSNIRKY